MGWPHNLAIVNSVVINIEVQVYFHGMLTWIVWGKRLGVV